MLLIKSLLKGGKTFWPLDVMVAVHTVGRQEPKNVLCERKREQQALQWPPFSVTACSMLLYWVWRHLCKMYILSKSSIPTFFLLLVSEILNGITKARSRMRKKQTPKLYLHEGKYGKYNRSKRRKLTLLRSPNQFRLSHALQEHLNVMQNEVLTHFKLILL